MGCFSFICKESDYAVTSDSFKGDAVRMYLLKDGKVLEEMRGHYNSYGSVFGFEWNMEWDDVCDLMFSENDGDGIAVILEKYFKGEIPTTKSDDDSNQGWGKSHGGKAKIESPAHIIY
jgi:hypothetical protein